MKAIVALIIAVSISTVVFAGNEKVEKSEKAEKQNVVTNQLIAGKVVDSLSGEALVGVAVMLDGSQEVAYTDFEGNFQFANAKVSQVSLFVSLISYEKLSIQATAGVENLKISLKQL
jgi:hypothetical protein